MTPLERLVDDAARAAGFSGVVRVDRRGVTEVATAYGLADRAYGIANTVGTRFATATPLATEWTNAEPIAGPVDVFVRELKAGDGGDIGVHGSISLTQSLLAAGLVDELRLLVAPRVAGSGRRLFEGDGAYSLELVQSVGTPSGSLLVHYRVVAGD